MWSALGRLVALATLVVGMTGAAAPALASTTTHPGEASYKTYCAACHDMPDVTRAPSRATMARMSGGQILNAMMTGKMTAQAAALSSKEMEAVAAYLSPPRQAAHDWVKAMACPAERRTPNLAAVSPVGNFGFDPKNRRNLSFAQSGFKPGDLSRLRLAWAIAFPDTVSMRSQAAVVGTTLFVPVGESGGRLFAFDVSDRAKPCVQWVYEAGRTLRSSAAFGVRSDGRAVVMVGDAAGHLHTVDARTGKRLWETQSGLFPTSISTGTPVLVGDRVIAPSSQYEIMVGASDAYECCKVHGGVVALDAMSGRRLWTYRTMEAAKPVRDRGDGQMLWGPSGAPVWTSPAIDVGRGLVYVGTGEATSPPAHRNTNALIAIDLATGKEAWSFQATANDIYLSGCNRAPIGRNCVPRTETVYRDVDFGASAVLARRPAGGDLLLGGQKSGAVWAMDPDRGTVVWRTDLGTGGPGGGVHWGMAADERRVYAPITLPGDPIPGQDVPAHIKHGLYALNLDSGAIDWAFHVGPTCPPEQKAFTPYCQLYFGLSGAPTIVGDTVITGGVDGRLYVVDRASGRLLWHFDTARKFDALNGVEGNGAAIDNASIVAVNGLLIVNSGYGQFGMGAGNVMLAFEAAP